MNLLIVDNNQQNCQQLQSMLKKEGHQVKTAGHGKEALTLLQDEHFDGIISSVVMPVMDGFQLCRTVKLHDTLKEIPFIFLTDTFFDDEAETFARALGANLFLRTAEPEKILSQIQKVLQNPENPTEILDEEAYLREYSARLKKGLDNTLQQIQEMQEKLSRSETKYEKSERQYRELFENAPIGIYRTTPDGCILMANHALLHLLGYSSFEELAQRNLEEGEFEAQYPRSAFKERLEREGKITGLESAWITKDGTTLFFRENAQVVRDDSGSILYYEGTVEDITERKKAEEQLKESEEEYGNIVELAPDGIVTVDLKGVFTSCNTTFSNLTGYSKEEIVGKHFTKLPTVRARDIPKYVKLFSSFIKGEFSTPFEFVWVHKDGTPRLAEAHATRVKKGSKRMGFQVMVRDITERKRAEEKLRESEEKYRNIVELAPDGIVTVDLKGVVTSCNTATLHLTGYSEEEIVGKHFTKLSTLRARDIPKYARMLNSLIRGKAPKPFEATWIHKDGTIRLGEAHATRVKKGNKTMGLQIMVRDITERKKAEEMLRLSEEKYRSLVENLNVGVYRATPGKKGQFIDVNHAFARMLGYAKKEDVLKLKVSDIYINPKDRKKFSEKISNQGFVRNEELHVKRKDGTPIIISDTATPVYDTEGTLLYFDGISEDITERKRIEEALTESEEKYRNLVENSKDSIVIIDVKGNVQFANKATAELTGYTMEEGLHMNVRQITPVKYWPKSFAMLKTAITGEPVPYFESAIRRKDKRIIPVESGGQAIFKDGKVVGIQVITRDITERKEAEEQIKQSLKEKEVLLQEIHHRVKNNMQVICSLLNLQSGYIEDEKMREVFKDSQNRIKSMALVHEKLYQSKALASIDFKEYIRSLVNSLFWSCRTDTGGITLRIDVEDVSLGSDHAIPCGLIINELVSNCLKHAFPDGKGEIVINLRSRNENVELVVADNGVGIPESIDFKNTKSLGLRLVTILAEGQLNGKISLNRSGGTEVRITFRVRT